MKKIIYYMVGITLLVAGLFSCKTNSYAQMREDEKEAWNKYVSENNLQISTDSAYCFSQPTPWPEKLYFQTPRGAYLHLINDNPNARKPQEGCKMVAYYWIYDVSGNFVNTNVASREGDVVVYTPEGSLPSVGLNDAYAYLHNGSTAIVLVDSQLGDATQQSAVKTYRFQIDEFYITN